ncbi:magnesium transporter NIPA-domain-containing protein [Epithele typhae]|uniref:magnesium transporter NIPA-domain-containing protein n=1 Tax=Epithele typhae TaxID=378194 RepID=UPI00200840E5|nr:magnesium transporter NIPA-domain-containing protein [Epithele typhae]KAH9931173.1 magnesium transporter NIPA-domain-containing protein [Epithele typhae]
MSSTFSQTSSTTSTSASASLKASSGSTLTVPGNLKIVGIILAIASGVLIGSSFVFKKKGLLRSQRGMAAGEGVAYLKSPLWWIGMTMMILGELCNFAAYAFVEAIVVTPMGALSVVICAILSSLFLNEKLSFFGWLGCALCVLGSVIIALNGPQEESIGQIREFQKLFLSPGFLIYGGILIASALVIIFYFAPRYGKKSMLWYIMVCSMIGGISVSVTTGLGSAIVTTAMGDNQFKFWFMYFLLVFVAVTLITEVYYLNVALALFNTAMVTPTYYVIFTFFSIVTTIVLFQGLSAPVTQIITLVMGFLVICVGITVLQLSKIDPTQIKTLDRRTTLLLQAAKNNTEGVDEKNLSAVEDPGMDALRGSFGTMGSIIRARSARRMSMSSRGSVHSRISGQPGSPGPSRGQDPLAGLKRHQLFDNPMPGTPGEIGDQHVEVGSLGSQSLGSPFTQRQRKQTIKFGDEELVHQYHTPGMGDNTATHERRTVPHASTPKDERESVSSSSWSAKAVVGANGEQTLPPDIGVPVLPLRDLFDSAVPLTAPPSLGNSGFAVNFPPISPGSRSRHLHLFGRSPGGRGYPGGDRADDEEESVSLFNRGSTEGLELDGGSDGDSSAGPGSVRLVGRTRGTDVV